MERFFRKFPIINYDGYAALNITERAAMLNSVLKNPYVFYQYDVTDGERADHLADRYYKDQYMTWLIYMANKVVDPYYEWYMGPEDFSAYIRSKYGSSEQAQQLVAFYRNAWYEDETRITPARYAALTAGERKYWEPVYGASNSIMGYKRKSLDWVVDTNQLVRYTADGTDFVDNEIVDVLLADDYPGRGQVAHANSTTVTIKHTAGTVLANDVVVVTGSSTITGTTSNAVSVVTVSTPLANNIPADEAAYWSPVTAYDVENEKNVANRSIRVLDKQFASQTARGLTDILKQ